MRAEFVELESRELEVRWSIVVGEVVDVVGSSVFNTSPLFLVHNFVFHMHSSMDWDGGSVVLEHNCMAVGVHGAAVV